MNKLKLAIFLIVLLFSFSCLLFKTIFNIFPWEWIAYGPIPDDVLYDYIGKFGRNYPSTIKGNWEPSMMHMAKIVLDDSENIKSLGINTLSVSIEYHISTNGTPYLNPMEEEMFKSNIVRAKQKGFAVLVAPNFVGPDPRPFSEKGINMDLKKYLDMSEQVALKWAKISEDYGVEFFAPQNELDVMIDQFVNDEEEKSRVVSEWHEEILPKIKQIFTGKMMAKLADSRENDYFNGYDYVGTTIFHRGYALENFRNYINRTYFTISQVAEKSNCSWLVSEAWMPYSFPFSKNENGESLDGLQDDYFKIATEEYLRYNYTNPAGFVFIAWIMDGMDIKNRPSEQVLREFYSKI